MPHNVSVMERAHNALVLEVYPPENDGGVTISGYNVEYREKIPDLIPLVDEGQYFNVLFSIDRQLSDLFLAVCVIVIITYTSR